MKNYLLLLLSGILFFSATIKNDGGTIKQDGVYMGKIELKQERGSLVEYHYIVFKANGKAETFVTSSNDFNAVKEKIKNNNYDYQGEYRIYENSLTYRSINKDAKAANGSTLYIGNINNDGSITLETTFANNSKVSSTFSYLSLK